VFNGFVAGAPQRTPDSTMRRRNQEDTTNTETRAAARVTF